MAKKPPGSMIKQPLFATPSFSIQNRDGFEAIAGNYIVIKQAASIYAAFCHLQKDSIAVSEGKHIAEGTYLGNVGHSGNSTEPHLHFQLMDSAMIESANGLPLVLRPMKIQWEHVGNRPKSVSATGERIRSLKSDRN